MKQRWKDFIVWFKVEVMGYQDLGWKRCESCGEMSRVLLPRGSKDLESCPVCGGKFLFPTQHAE